MSFQILPRFQFKDSEKKIKKLIIFKMAFSRSLKIFRLFTSFRAQYVLALQGKYAHTSERVTEHSLGGRGPKNMSVY